MPQVLGGAMKIITTTHAQSDLPRYFARVFDLVCGMKHGRLDFVLPDSRVFRAQGRQDGPAAQLIVHDPDLFSRLVREGDLGFCDAYLEGWWSTPDLQVFMDLMNADNDEIYNGFPGMIFVRGYERFRFWLRSNSRRQAKKNIAHHYDLGNEFYRLWLDRTMTYSSAKFDSGNESLEKAQLQKYASAIDQLGAKPGDHVLEIGCGWGGFAEYAAKERGLKVTGLTISKQQHAYATARMEQAGLVDRVTIKLQDYRDERDVYDGIVSIEMFEAVGEKYWPVFFDTLRKRLKPGKAATLQIITLPEQRYKVYRRGVDFIQKYIFPGGMLPSRTILHQQVERAGLQVIRSIEFGESYSRTLRKWHVNFNEKWGAISNLGFDERFRRMWNFYLTSCASAFQSGNCDVTQITVTRRS